MIEPRVSSRSACLAYFLGCVSRSAAGHSDSSEHACVNYHLMTTTRFGEYRAKHKQTSPDDRKGQEHIQRARHSNNAMGLINRVLCRLSSRLVCDHDLPTVKSVCTMIPFTPLPIGAAVVANGAASISSYGVCERFTLPSSEPSAVLL